MKEKIPSHRSEKDRLWAEKAEEVDRIVDGLELGIDEGIKEAVTAFMVHEFPTSSSCEGHPDDEHGLNFPWIDIEADAPEGWENDEVKKEEWKTENLKYREKLQGFLDEFYADRDVPDEFKLGFKDRGIYGAFRMESVRAEDLTDKEQAESYEKYREEMEDFTKFLKDKFFEED